jgi:outer membrane lipoprotein SlyB
VVGGVLGNQIGGGTGKTVATVAGAAGGAYAGKKVAENTSRTRYKVTVRMDNGHTEVCDQGSAKNLHVGDYVKISNGKAYRL